MPLQVFFVISGFVVTGSLLRGKPTLLVKHAHELLDDDNTIVALDREAHQSKLSMLTRLLVRAAEQHHKRTNAARLRDANAI